MIEEALETQRNLITVLLTYPKRANQVLNTHQKLIDSDFVELIEQVSVKMASAGNQVAAEFLENLATHIRQEFLTEVLQVGKERIRASEIISRLTRYQMLPQLLSEIIIDQAIASIDCTPEEKTKACQLFYEQNHLTDEDLRRAWCDYNRLTLEQVEDLAIRPLKIHKFQRANWEDKLESYFLERKADLDQVSYSMIRLKDPELAQELYFRLEEREQSFAAVARQYSRGLEAQNGGLIGPMPLKMPHPIIVRLLKSSKPGQLCPPTPLEEWIVIVRLEKFIPAQLNGSMRQRLLNELFQNWLSEQLNQQQITLVGVEHTSTLDNIWAGRC